MSPDIGSHCRVCLKVCKNKAKRWSDNIYKSSNTPPDRPSLHTMLSMICAVVFDGDGRETKESLEMPSAVCVGCKQKILAAYELHQACIEADGKLREMMGKKQDMEPEEPLNAMDVLYLKQEVDEEPFVEHPDEGEEYNDDEFLEPKKEEKTVEIQAESKPKLKQGLEAFDAAARTCEICSKVFKKIQQVQDHLKEAHADQVTQCDQCEEVLPSDIKLDDHRLYHETGKRYACDVCKKRFQTRDNLRIHVRSHADYQRYKCSVCDKQVNTKSLLRQHMLKHNGERNFPCELCPMRCQSKGDLKTHMVTHTRKIQHLCDICGKNFTMNKSLVRHRRLHAGVEERPHACADCGASFKSAFALKRHRMTHTGEKPFKCIYCERAYAQSNDLAKHIRVHLGDKPYKCDLCETSFRFLTELRNHYGVHSAQSKDKAELSQLGKQHFEKHGKVPIFTVSAALSRRFEQEMHQE